MEDVKKYIRCCNLNHLLCSLSFFSTILLNSALDLTFFCFLFLKIEPCCVGAIGRENFCFENQILSRSLSFYYLKHEKLLFNLIFCETYRLFKYFWYLLQSMVVCTPPQKYVLVARKSMFLTNLRISKMDTFNPLRDYSYLFSTTYM